jgi:hypothetical protein
MSDPTTWGFETRRSTPASSPTRPPARGPCRSTRRRVLRLQRHRARGEPVRAQGVRQHLHPDHEPDAGWSRSGSRRSRVASGRCSSPRVRPRRRSACSTSPRPATTSSPARRSTAARYNLLKYTFKKLGIEVTFVEDQADLEAWRAPCVRTPRRSSPRRSPTPRPRCSTSPGSPGSPTRPVCRSSSTTPSRRPTSSARWSTGADVVIHSATKYLGGHGTSIAGVIVDGGTFDYGADPEKFPNYNTPEESYHGLVFARDLGVGGALGANLAFILKARVQLLRDLGSASLAVQRLPHRAGHRDAQPARRAAHRERRAVAAFLSRPPAGGVGALGLARRQPEQGAGRRSTRPRVPVRCSRSRSPVVSRRGSASSRG